jgi:hypothetical protein
MSILDNLLGNSNGDSSSSTHDALGAGTTIGTDPQLGLSATDILHSQSGGDSGDSGSSFTGIGSLGLGLAAPTVVGVNASNDLSSDSMHSSTHDCGGGLLGGLL